MLDWLVDWILYSVAGLNPDALWAKSLNYFIYDSIKILLLLFIVITLAGFLRSYIPEHKMRKWMGGRYGFGNLMASLFGAITPFCSCSSIPIFISFLRAGVPLGTAFSFLITSPIVNEYLVVLMWGFFGWKIALAYTLSGILIGVFSGMVLGRMGLEKHLVEDLAAKYKKIESKSQRILKKELKHDGFKSRLKFGLDEAMAIIKKLWLWVLAGVALGAVLHNYVPEELIHSIVSRGGLFSVPIAVLLGVPLYGSCAAIVPIAVVLFQKGVPIGTALAFMMAVAALSLPEAVILRRAMKLKLIAIFFGIVALAILLTGYLFNFLQGTLV
jgi:uncharacterized protein